MSKWTIGLIGLFLLIILGCGGGGTSVPPTLNEVTGYILWVETGSATDPQSTVRIGDVSGQTDAFDGFFSLEVPDGATSLTVTYVPAGGSPIVRTFTFPAIQDDTDLGALYIGPESVTLVGNVQDSSTLIGVPGAHLKIAGRSGVSSPDGSFSIPDVAYSSSTQNVFLGLQGTVTKTGYFQGTFSPNSVASGGVVNVGNILIVPEGNGTPPPLPSNLSGTVLPDGFGATIQAKQGTTVIRTTTVDSSNSYRLWLPAGTYTIEATKGASFGSTSATIVNVNQPITANITFN